ncbi:putative lipoprotein mlpA precursor [Cystobacter fuscus DSM 2262]|uniref:Lipoprotein mlpA n=1 Tax=Cystobacter fuscus (strain ATCC 25194 / DSM 2262 / NBRC 100088 / M29) TaxID=1242864 RepID=S9PK86_CYSF2|nr:putative lipoprotein mlpA precursor [Cystobacter fuscus DSM 2262]
MVARAVSDGAPGSFAATYSLKPGEDPARACAQLKSEPVGLQKYLGEEGALDSVSLRTARVGKLVKEAMLDPAAANQPNSVGALTTEAPGPDNFCEVPVLNPTQLVTLASSSEGAKALTYEWSGLRIYNTPSIPGTQFIADLRYTENGCTAQYTVRGIWPVVSCATNNQPDESKCDPYADPPRRLRGSGINPSFPVKCDPIALLCVLTGEVPSVP